MNALAELSDYLIEECQFCDDMMKKSVAQNDAVAWKERKDAMRDVLEQVNELIQEEVDSLENQLAELRRTPNETTAG